MSGIKGEPNRDGTPPLSHFEMKTVRRCSPTRTAERTPEFRRVGGVERRRSASPSAVRTARVPRAHRRPRRCRQPEGGVERTGHPVPIRLGLQPPRARKSPGWAGSEDRPSPVTDRRDASPITVLQGGRAGCVCSYGSVRVDPFGVFFGCDMVSSWGPYL
jgi:hypothetical protein